MNGFRVLATNHTSFTVSDLDRSIAFFTEVLGFEMVNRAPRDPKLISSITGVPGADIEVAYIQGPGHRLERGPPVRQRDPHHSECRGLRRRRGLRRVQVRRRIRHRERWVRLREGLPRGLDRRFLATRLQRGRSKRCPTCFTPGALAGGILPAYASRF